MPPTSVFVLTGSQTGLARFVQAPTVTGTLVAQEMVKPNCPDCTPKSGPLLRISGWGRHHGAVGRPVLAETLSQPRVPGCNTSSTPRWIVPSVTAISLQFKVHGSVTHPRAVKERSGPNCVGVRVGRRVRLTGDVRLQKRESRRVAKIGAALNEVGHPANALPGYGDPRSVGQTNGSQHLEYGRRVGRIGPGDPFLPVVHPVVIRVRVIRRAVREQTVLLEPADEFTQAWALELVGAHIRRAADDAGAAVEVRAAHHVNIVAGVDARRVGL